MIAKNIRLSPPQSRRAAAVRRTASPLWFVLLALALPLACKERGQDGDEDERKEARGASSGTEKEVAESEPGEVKISPEAVARYGIKTEPARTRILIPTIIAPARVAFDAGRMAHVGSTVAGRVADVRAQISDPVKKGDELIIVESAELGEAQSDLLQKRAALESGTSALEPLKNAYERGKTLYDQGQGVSLADVQKREAEYKSAQAALHTASAGARAAENKLRLLGMDDQALATLADSSRINPRFVIASPISGVITDSNVTLGQLVGPEKEVLMTVADMTTVWVLADVPEAKVAEIAPGSKAVVKVAAFGSDSLEGKVSAISPALDPTTRSAQVRIEVKSGHITLRPGMFAQTEIEVAANAASSQPVLAVPEQAVMTLKGGTVVFVPEEGEENSFQQRAVTVGPAVGGMVPILSGLKEGDPVVVAGAFILKAELGKGEAEEGD